MDSFLDSLGRYPVVMLTVDKVHCIFNRVTISAQKIARWVN